MNREIYNRLSELVPQGKVCTDEPMAKHTTFRVGGAADYFVVPATKEELRAAVGFCRGEGIPFYILGNGSNLLVSDNGYRGVVIQIYKNLDSVTVTGDILKVQGGALLSKVARQAMEHQLAGFEFAAGIPGTMGGAVVMNAGAYGGEMKHVIQSAEVLKPDGEVEVLQAAELELGYRTSIIQKKGHIVLEAEIKLEAGAQEAIRSRIEELREQRTSKQPLEYPSAGSTFKRPEGYFAGKLIMDAGLRGFQFGGAAVAEKHCGFIINKNGASADDIYRLIAHVKAEVKHRFQVELEAEVKMLGDFKKEV